MVHNYSMIYDNVKLIPLQLSDIEKLREWRNDTTTTKFLRSIGYITTEMQENWFRNYLKNDREITFAIIETKALNRIVGSVSIYNIENDIAEIGRIQIGDIEAHGKGIGKKALLMALIIGFDKLHLQKIKADVHQENIAAHKNHISIGFKITGQKPFYNGGFEDEMEISKKMLSKKNKDFIKDIKLMNPELLIISH